MALPQIEADWKRAAEYIHTTYDVSLVGRTRLLDMMTEPRLPKLRSLPYRLWCGLRGHGRTTPIPGDVFYFHEALCKRCGSRVTV